MSVLLGNVTSLEKLIKLHNREVSVFLKRSTSPAEACFIRRSTKSVVWKSLSEASWMRWAAVENETWGVGVEGGSKKFKISMLLITKKGLQFDFLE